MGKCPVRYIIPAGGQVRCQRYLSQCLRDWSHVGRRWTGVKGRFVSFAWRFQPEDLALATGDWQRVIRAELRRLDYECKYASEAKNPYLYRKHREDRTFVAQYVVRARRNRFGTMESFLGTDATPIGQSKLGRD